MKIGLLGCGAMGSLYGGYLSKVHEVYVCDVWKEHIEAIRANGIRLDEPEGETAVFTPKYATTDPSEIGPEMCIRDRVDGDATCKTIRKKQEIPCLSKRSAGGCSVL